LTYVVKVITLNDLQKVLGDGSLKSYKKKFGKWHTTFHVPLARGRGGEQETISLPPCVSEAGK